MLRILSRRLLRQGMALLLGLALLIGQVSPSLAAPWSKQRSQASSPSGSESVLQEVAPPGAAQQLSDQLRGRQPQLSVISPKPGSEIATGEWTLQLQLEDWPVLESSELGPGPHVVVQLDQQEPLRIFESNAKGVISVAMPPLMPGSHHLSAFAALPWGEAAAGKNARIQWQLYRGLATPEALPDLQAPQLVAVAPQQLSAGAAVPINWFLFNAPLQHLRDGDEQWRLRLSLDGSSVVLDRAQSLWLKPLKAGEHFLKLELLDGDGNPLQPAFNSLVQELNVPSRGLEPRPCSAPASTPISWLSSVIPTTNPHQRSNQSQSQSQKPNLNLRPSLNSKSQQWQPPKPNRAIQQPR